MKNKLLIALALITLSGAALADQCQAISEASAKTAVNLVKLSVKNSGGVLSFCQNCGEKEVTQLKVNQIDIGKTNITGAPSELSLNGEGIDLAYTYVNISKGTWVNLAMLSNCPVDGASQFILEKTNSAGEVKFIPSKKF